MIMKPNTQIVLHEVEAEMILGQFVEIKVVNEKIVRLHDVMENNST